MDYLNAAIAAAVVYKLIISAGVMTKETRHIFRLSSVTLAVMCMAYVLWPFYYDDVYWPSWGDTIFILAIAGYVWLDKRRSRVPAS